MSNLNYTTLQTQLALFMVTNSTDSNFQSFLPGCIDYAENRIYRDLDPLYVQTIDSGSAVSSGNRDFTTPTNIGTFITIDSVNILTPVSATATNGTRNPLTPVSPEVIDALYPSGQTVTGVPAYFALRSPSQIVLGPAPDAAYTAEVSGIQRPAALSSANSSNYLTQYIPDVYFAAAMVYASGYQRDFGSQADNPAQAQSWENQYKTLLQSATTEQARAKFEAEGWTSQSPSPLATPKRV